MSWATTRPSSGGGFVSAASRKKVRSSSGGPPAASGPRGERTKPRTSVERVANAVVEGLKEPPSPPRSFPPTADVDALEQALVMSIRAAGLKLGRWAGGLQSRMHAENIESHRGWWSCSMCVCIILIRPFPAGISYEVLRST